MPSLIRAADRGPSYSFFKIYKLGGFHFKLQSSDARTYIHNEMELCSRRRNLCHHKKSSSSSHSEHLKKPGNHSTYATVQADIRTPNSPCDFPVAGAREKSGEMRGLFVYSNESDKN
uniref:Uncharacterized protein n=1 Tax=Glossina palpalis gambiensis TaxID=67801 RepID=A0A1B0BDL4_9MUSC